MAPLAWLDAFLAFLSRPGQGRSDIVRRSAGLPAGILAVLAAGSSGTWREVRGALGGGAGWMVEYSHLTKGFPCLKVYPDSALRVAPLPQHCGGSTDWHVWPLTICEPSAQTFPHPRSSLLTPCPA